MVLIASIAVGLLITVFRADILPPRFFYDGIRIQREASGLSSVSSDESYAAVAKFYGVLGLGPRPEMAALFGFIALVSVVVLARVRLPRGAAPTAGSVPVLLVTVLMGSVYLGFYSKDVIVLGVAALALALPHGLKYELAFILVLVGYGAEFRTYWFLVAASYAGLRIAWSLIRGGARLTSVIALGVALISLGFLLFLGSPPDFYREQVNQFRAGPDAVTVITRLVDGDGLLNSEGLLGGFVNVSWVLANLVVPATLAALGTPYHLALAVALGMTNVFFLRAFVKALGNPELRADSVLVRSLCLIMALLIVQSFFEPDFGSASRHMSPLLPLVLYAIWRTSSPDGLRPSAEAGERPSVKAPSGDRQ